MTEDSHLCTRNSICMPTTQTRLSSWNYSLCSSWQLCPISQQTAENHTLWTSLCETLILGVSLHGAVFILELVDIFWNTLMPSSVPGFGRIRLRTEKTYIRQRLIWCKPNRYGHEGPCQPSTIRYEIYSTTGSHPELTFRKVYYTILWSNLPKLFQRRRFVRCLFLRHV